MLLEIQDALTAGLTTFHDNVMLLHIVVFFPAMIVCCAKTWYFAVKKRKQTDQSLLALEDLRFMIVNSSKTERNDLDAYKSYYDDVAMAMLKAPCTKNGYLRCKAVYDKIVNYISEFEKR